MPIKRIVLYVDFAVWHFYLSTQDGFSMDRSAAAPLEFSIGIRVWLK